MYLLRIRRHYHPQKSPKTLSHAGNDCLYMKTGALNSSMTSDFKPEVVTWSKLRTRSQIQIGENQRQTDKNLLAVDH